MTNETQVIHGHISTHILEENGYFPNNSQYPVIVYKGAIHLHPGDEPEVIINLFEKNNWLNGWKDGILTYDHYHSNTHEVLAVFCGTADIQLGGLEGVIVELSRGDVLIIPAGVAYRNINSSKDFLCVGAYPDGAEYDMNYGKPEERDEAVSNIAKVPVPRTDPVYGDSGGLLEIWSKPQTSHTDSN